MKIKLIHYIHGLTMGGAETLVKDYCLLLDREKFDVSVLCMDRCDTPYERILEDAGIRILYISDEIEKHIPRDCGILGKICRRALLYREVRRILRREQPDVVHTHLTLNRYVLAAGLPRTTKIFHTVHTKPSNLWRGDLLHWMEYGAMLWLLQTHTVQILTLHERMRQEVSALFHTEQVQVLNNGVDFHRFEGLPSGAEVRMWEGIPPTAFVIGHVGRFSEEKNHLFLLEIFAEVKRQQPRAFLLLVGDGDLKQKVEERAAELGLTDSMKILSNRTDVPELMRAMDRFVFPSMYEGLGIALIEAQLTALPCVISTTVPARAIISNLVQQLDLSEPPASWAKVILSDGPAQAEYRNAEEWDMNQVIRQLEKLYLA